MRAACRWLVAGALLASLSAAPAGAQPADERIPAEMLAPSAEAQSYFESLESGAIDSAEVSAMVDRLAPHFEPAFVEMMVRGERVENWRESGDDLEQAVAARPGGLAGNMIETTTDFGLDRTYFGDRPLASLLPPELRPIARHGPAVEGEEVVTEVAHISPRLVLALRSIERHEGKARCIGSTQALFYSDPRIAATEADMIAFVFWLSFVRRIEALDMCAMFEELEPGTYRLRSIDGEGYSLPNLDQASQPVRIVPFAPFPPATPRGERSDIAG